MVLAELRADGMSVTLTLDPSTKLAEDTDYTVTVTESTVMDLAGNPIDGHNTATFRSFAFSAGLLAFDYFNNLSTSDNSLDSTLLVDPRFPGNPTTRSYTPVADSRFVFPDNTHEGYGGRLSGLFVPNVSGNWVFYLASDDSSRLFLNPTGTDPAGKVPMTEETGCCNPWTTHVSAPQALTAGTRYYIEALYKEGTGGDYVKVAARMDTDPPPPDNPNQQIPISAYAISSQLLGAFVDKTGAQITITQQPQDVTDAIDPITGAHPDITFSVSATGSRAINPNETVIVKWQRDSGSGFADIPGAFGNSYKLTPVLTDNGAKFRALLFIPGASAISSTATLTVIQLNTPPQFACGPDQVVAQGSGAHSVANWATGIKPSSIPRTPIAFASSFDTQPTGSLLFGNAAPNGTITNGVLHLTDAVNGAYGAFYTPPIAAPIESYSIHFNALVGGGTCCGDPTTGGATTTADGFSANIAGDLPIPAAYGSPGEEGAGTGLSILFDTWDNGGGEAPAIDLAWKGAIMTSVHTQVAQSPDPTLDVFKAVTIDVTADGLCTVTFDGTNIFDHVPLPGYAPAVNLRLGFGARTGGANENHWIDDLNVTAFPQDASSAEAGQTVKFVVSNDNPSMFSVQPAVSPSGTLSYTPAADGCGVAHVSVVAMDNGGTAGGGKDTSDPCSFTITINNCVPPNHCPVANPLSLFVGLNGQVNFQLVATDLDMDPLTYSISGAPAHGIVVLQVQTGAASYSPSQGYTGPDSFSFTANDGKCTSPSATVSITVTNVGGGSNTAPTAKIVASPLADLSPLVANKVLISNNGSNACVQLDGSMSSDKESPLSALKLQWFIVPSAVPFASGLVTSNCLELGTYTIMLVVTDPQGLAGTESLIIDVLTAGEATDELITFIDQSQIARSVKRPFFATLKSAIVAADRGQNVVAANLLHAFQNKVRAQIAPSDATLARELTRMAQEIIDALNR